MSSDDLDDTVDYGAVSEAVARVVVVGELRLLERLAARIAEVCRADPRVLGVVVEVRKLHPPVRAPSTTSACASSVDARLPRARFEPRRPGGLPPGRGRRARERPRTSRVVAVSPVYETVPVGGPAQDDYLNAVVAIDTDLDPWQLLAVAHACEEHARRVRAERFGPRTLDVDILLFDDVEMDDPALTIPHPRMWERDFVLAPLRDVAPDLVAGRGEASDPGRTSESHR